MDKVIYNDGFNFNANDLQFTEDSRISSINCLAKSLVKLPGVATGLEITQLVAGSSQLLISLGTAINSEGNLIVTTADQSYAVVAGDIGKYLCLSYTDNDANFEAHPITGIAAATRKLSSFVLITKVTASSLDIILCKIISLNAGNVEWSLLERSCLGLTLANSQVTNLFVAINAAIEERKIAFDDAAGHAHTGQGGTGKRIGYEHLKNLPVIPNPEVANRDLHSSGIVSSNPEILKPTGSSAYNAVYFTPTLNNEDCAYIGGKKYTGLLSGGLPLSDLPGVYYNFASTDPAGMYVIFADGLANGLLKAEIILSMTDVQSYYDNKDYMPLCVVTLTSIGVIALDTVVDLRLHGTIGTKQLQKKQIKAEALADNIDMSARGFIAATTADSENFLSKTPDYDSGWIQIPAGSWLELTHNLNTVEVMVYFTGRESQPPGGDGTIHQKFYGGMYWPAWSNYVGGLWNTLTPTTIIIQRTAYDMSSSYYEMRVWIWRL